MQHCKKRYSYSACRPRHGISTAGTVQYGTGTNTSKMTSVTGNDFLIAIGCIIVALGAGTALCLWPLQHRGLYRYCLLYRYRYFFIYAQRSHWYRYGSLLFLFFFRLVFIVQYRNAEQLHDAVTHKMIKRYR